MKRKKILLIIILNLILAIISLLLFLKLWISGSHFADYRSIQNAEIIIFNNLWGLVAKFLFLTIFSLLITFIVILKNKNSEI